MRRRRLFPALGYPSLWTPLALGSSLLAWWDAERSDLITQAGGLVSSWRDVVGGYDAVQAVGGSQPIWSATSFNGRPGITGDGTDDELTLAPVPAAIPIGANACEMWAVVSQAALVADATLRMAFSYGNTTATARNIQRVVDTGNNRARGNSGDGASARSSLNTAVDFSTRHVVRLRIDLTAFQCDVDQQAGAVSATASNTASSRLRFFASAAATAANFWNGGVNTGLLVDPTQMSSSDDDNLYAYLNRRL